MRFLLQMQCAETAWHASDLRDWSCSLDAGHRGMHVDVERGRWGCAERRRQEYEDRVVVRDPMDHPEARKSRGGWDAVMVDVHGREPGGVTFARAGMKR